ncbi:MAG: MBL fold metallo-hydrolase [Planctomycetota bacterium]
MRYKLRFLGCGDAFSSGARHNTCMLVQGPGTRFLVDCGATTLLAMREQQIDPGTLDAIYLSHFHGDHFGGIPALLLEAKFETQRTRPLCILGPPGVGARVRELQEVLYPGMSTLPLGFDLTFQEYEVEVPLRFADVTVTPYRVAHSSHVEAFALRFDLGDRVFTYSGDTEWTQSLVTAARGADLLVCECYSFEEPIPGHLDYRAFAARRGELDCRRLILTHLGSAMLDNLGLVREEIATDGLEVVI